jgi:hypothetical protein
MGVVPKGHLLRRKPGKKIPTVEVGIYIAKLGTILLKPCAEKLGAFSA